jgi:two-component system chemotaxis response regulator CheY
MNTSIGVDELSVLVVEPSHVQSHFIQMVLHEIGVSKVHAVTDGASALNYMHENQPKLTISSMYLVDMSGSDLVEKMRADKSLTNIAFILVSSEHNPHYLDPVRQSGVSAILNKPFDLKDMRAAIHTTLDFINLGSLSFENANFDIESLRVLIVDDSSSASSYLKKVLNNIGINKITVAENGKKGAEVVQAYTFDLVITDFNMPEMDGRDLAEFIRTKSWQPELPILMITSEQNEKRLAAAKSAGVSSICGKPFEPSNLKNIIENLFVAKE